MTGLSKITDKILAEAQAEAAAIKKQAEAEAAQIMASYQKKAGELRRAAGSAAEREAAGIVSRAKSGAALAERNAMLQARADLVDRAFRRAHDEIRQLSEDKYLEFLTSLLLAILKRVREEERISREVYGEEDAPATEVYEILLCASDLEKYRKSLPEALRRRLIGNANADLAEKLHLSPKAADIDGGLILRCGDIEINASLSMLIDSVRATHEVRVSHILFD